MISLDVCRIKDYLNDNNHFVCFNLELIVENLVF